MKTKTIRIILLILVLIAVTVLVVREYIWNKPTFLPTPGPTQIPDETRNFAKADKVRSFSFPADHGPHNNFKTEWWYYTGNLSTKSGKPFGYQLTFFRRALTAEDETFSRDSDWATSQVYMGHFALTDASGKQFFSSEKLQREAVDLAGAKAVPYKVWLDDWYVEETSPNQFRLYASEINDSDQYSIDLTLDDQSPPVLHGDNGLSLKGEAPGQASYYYSLTGLKSRGTIRINDQEYEVEGSSWMDHEFSTSALSKDQVGWDWFAVRFEDGSKLMLFQIRREDGKIDPFSSGTFIFPDGRTQHLNKNDFVIQVKNTWESPATGAVYPSEWRVTIPGQDLLVEIKPYLADQENKLSYVYWEGAVNATGTKSGKPLNGNGYVELTGYLQSMGEEF